MLRNIHIHTHDTVLEIQLRHSFSRVFDHAYYMCVFLCVSPCVCSCVHVCVLWAGRQCSILISREEPISCLACSLNVTGDFFPLWSETLSLFQSQWDLRWFPSHDSSAVEFVVKESVINEKHVSFRYSDASLT